MTRLLESIMKIGQLDHKAAVAPTVNERKAGSASPAKGGTEASAKVELSASALSSADAGESVFDADKVQRIADAIRDGKFQVNAEAIADKLIANAQDLLSPTRKGA